MVHYDNSLPIHQNQTIPLKKLNGLSINLTGMHVTLLALRGLQKTKGYVNSPPILLPLFLYLRYGMSNLIERVGGSIDSLAGGETFASWTGELSPGEMQIISFLRLLYHHLLPQGNKSCFVELK